MCGLYIESILFNALLDLKKASGVTGNEYISARIFQMSRFPVQEPPGHFGLDEVIYTGTAAAEVRFRKLD